MEFKDFEAIYALGLDDLLFGDDDRDATPEEQEVLAAIAAESFGSGHGGLSGWLGLVALVRSITG